MSMMEPWSLALWTHSTWWLAQSLRWQNVEQYGVRRHSEHSANASLLQLEHWNMQNNTFALVDTNKVLVSYPFKTKLHDLLGTQWLFVMNGDSITPNSLYLFIFESHSLIRERGEGRTVGTSVSVLCAAVSSPSASMSIFLVLRILLSSSSWQAS